jgi:hypothetical protein
VRRSLPAQVYSCAPKGNPTYTFRESIPLGVTAVSAAQFRRSIEGLQDEWQGWTYDLLSRNCNHFCEVPPTPLSSAVQSCADELVLHRAWWRFWAWGRCPPG